MSCSNLRFLVVEDHDLQRRVLAKTLRGTGALSMHAAKNGRDALRVLRGPDRPVDIVRSRDEWLSVHQWGCQMGNGPFISPPMAADAVPDWVAQWKATHSHVRLAVRT